MAFENNQDLLTIGISLLINVIFGVFILYSHRERKRIYKMLKEVNHSIKEKNEAILSQSTKLAEAYENLWKINQRLEDEVRFNTDKVKNQRGRLREHIHFNTHKLRGTMASMQGLLLLAQREGMSKNVSELFEMLHVCIRQLDEIVGNLTQQLDDDL
jgi:gas vesicle protein